MSERVHTESVLQAELERALERARRAEQALRDVVAFTRSGLSPDEIMRAIRERAWRVIGWRARP